MPRGGKRPGAGRPPGARNRRTVELQRRIEASGDTPVEFLTKVYRNGELELPMRIEAARAVAPYVHPRLNSSEVSLTSGDSESEEVLLERLQEQFAQHPEELARLLPESMRALLFGKAGAA
jgi:hypothetical protein